MSDLINKKVPTEDFQFQYISISPQDGDACKMPQAESWSKFLSEHKTVVLTGAPAAFSPTCSINHIPAYIKGLKELEAKGVDQVVVVTVDNPFANAAWAKSLGVKDTSHIKFASDAGGKFVKKLGLDLPVADGVSWSGRWAAIVKDGTITYAGKETKPAEEVTVSSFDSVLKHL
ncbi:AHP1 (YLR109W) [Zygosaccharomyces parabailii]|uniref:ZYBA0S07-03400g1_1 n=1 Tax=Zygosaccharomyces bailii (strain CLIB 213 / ATCC 58445 / CBS 680 / BCRC 21525 / NBRC 1098 / NCYC 1416 / NRRL Y-2227) TaxID=1333698 RepID=A0A8J2T9P0_ZYGB2|nr:AHP1 (YLR109W) [Zygosaccharomyces parabailii]AQZ13458.1 AHP1 (YLR109W) [Zygosaccharomyces parabailii]CDF90541.1 ZYBA0S07-03400g1_1 [Zygosaccharomyces bailii CLIB 213]CDH10691.1 probable Peroxiredoxin type-2 [Zygosaccharomyces bailii ISA1307]CDH15093.1 probable Peroxiredoxin type-2 [Zygosaccharomyces bailii ISA1307]